ncbi:MAG TPA: phosphoribosylformylglycinamidine synthase subunit PurS [Nitrososphaerales archaeon]|nr:phosphoribosylformylglycinamidine synthase subunit PurS [Nitrososphaerales archaeon]
MEKYLVSVMIENKAYINDPEGETILKDLIAKGGYSTVKAVRTAKMLNLTIEARDRKDAEDTVRKLCDELRIYNPVVSNCKVESVNVAEARN